jgi:tRNA threonylcarbamoyladenosine biosynthesis protein TsaB
MIVAEAARAQIQPGGGGLWQIAVAMDARMNEVYAARYAWRGGQWQTLQAPGLHSLAALSEDWAQQRADAAAGSALTAFGERLLWPIGIDQRFASEEGRASALLRLALQAHAQGQGMDAAEALPLYLRDKVAQTTAERQAEKAQEAQRVQQARQTLAVDAAK